MCSSQTFVTIHQTARRHNSEENNCDVYTKFCESPFFDLIFLSGADERI
jgi:hypothetical protein